MITMNVLGRKGRLGNQMFQYAMLIGVGDKHGYRVIIDEDIDSKSHNNFSIRNIFDIKLSHFYHEAGIHTNKKYSHWIAIFDLVGGCLGGRSGSKTNV